MFVSGIGPLRLLFRPILIPWDEMIIAEQPFVGLKRYELIPLEVPELQLILPKTLANNLNQEMKNVIHSLDDEESSLSLSVEEFEGEYRTRTE